MAVLEPEINRLAVQGTVVQLLEDISPDLQRNCDHCTKPFDFEQSSWFWSFGATKLKMHTACFLDWMRRMSTDVTKCKELQK